MAVAEDRAPRRTHELGRLGMALVLLCLIQYLLGMGLNLYVSVPRHHPGSSGGDFFLRAWQSVLWGLAHGTLLATHAGLGILILLGSLRLLLAAFRAPAAGGLRWMSLLGLLAVVGAGFNGAAFLSYHLDLSSMIMAAGLALAVFCFSWVAFQAGSNPKAEAAPGA